jgi:membrane protein insertase Oxa1/YidC/SpoIIIJ
MTNSKIKKYLNKLVAFSAFYFFMVTFAVTPASAACPPNVLPNPIDPNCENTNVLSIGYIGGRAISFLPIIVAISAAVMYAIASFKLMMSQSDDDRNEAIKMFVYITAAIIAFFSIGLIMTLVSFIIGVDLLKLIGL